VAYGLLGFMKIPLDICWQYWTSLLKEAMYVDTKFINKYSIGAKTIQETANYDKWKFNETFMFIRNNAYVYYHGFHTTFSSIEFLQLMKLWKVQSQDISRMNEDVHAFCRIHEHHDVFEPFFQTNSALKLYVNELCVSGRVSEDKLKILTQLYIPRK